jgi:hypothetical protein
VALADGWAVYSADGEDLGSVDGMRDAFFKVNAPLGFDFYVRYALIERSQDEVVHLRATRSQLLREHLATSVPPDSLLKSRDEFGDWRPDQEKRLAVPDAGSVIPPLV